MSIEAWPFLVSRNTTFDYRIVVAPQYMIDNKVSSLLAKAAGGDVTNPMSAICREVYHPNPEVGDSTLIFRIAEANDEYVGLEGNEVLKDRYGRPIHLIEGLVVRGVLADGDKLIVTEDDLLDAHRSMQKDYQTFWYETDSTPPVRSSMPLDLPLDDLSRKSATEKVLRLSSVPAYTVRLKVSAPLTQPEFASSQTPRSSQETSLSPTSTKTKEEWIDEGDLFAAGGFYEEALNAYDQALQLPSSDRRDNAPAYRGKGDVFYYQRSYKEAEDAYDQALKCNNKYALAHNGKGLIFYSRKDYRNAITSYDQAIKLDFNCALAYANKGSSLRDDIEREKGIRRMDSREIKVCETKSREAFEHAVAAYNRLLQTEEKAIWYHYQVIALKQLGPKRNSEAKKAEEKARQLGYSKKGIG